ncbi:iron-siderophore ABC transporter substrate-binding protein [Pseudonocardia ailaonensis]|uniref:Iron-siderophore ABC transporter substrate-binding protein n=1 Tax=Pseudonocardia ailaonensis TaxID=367279 RepID=A0ABN2NJH6_9PSEU
MPRSTLTRLVLGLTAAALALGTVACAGAPAATTAAAATRTVDTIRGPIEIPADAKRIVAINFPEAMALLDLGIVPIGLPTYVPKVPAYDALIATVPRVDANNQIDVEKVAALKPDVIIGSDFAPSSPTQRAGGAIPYDKLSAIAPTVLFEWKVAGGNWQDEASRTAAAVGRSADMTTLADGMHRKAAQIRSTHADVLGRTTWDLVSGQPGAPWYLYGPASSHGVVLGEAGIRFGAAAGQKDNFVQQSGENFGVLNGTNGLIVSVDASGNNALAGQAGYDNLAAVKADHTTVTKWFFPAGYQAANLLLDDLDKALTAYGRNPSS